MATVSESSKKQEQEWQTEEDARTMQRMGEIMGDEGRHGRAKKKMEEMIADMKKSKKAMEMMAGAKMNYDKSPRSPEKVGADGNVF